MEHTAHSKTVFDSLCHLPVPLVLLSFGAPVDVHPVIDPQHVPAHGGLDLRTLGPIYFKLRSVLGVESLVQRCFRFLVVSQPRPRIRIPWIVVVRLGHNLVYKPLAASFHLVHQGNQVL